jgi:CelD/BcsL family acetyltransferase involved in cellulose biosynthesis
MFDSMLIAYDRQHGGEAAVPHRFSDTRNIEFYRRMIQEGLRGGWLHISTLVMGGKTISWHIGFLWKGRFYWYKPCYDVREERSQPGHLHIAHLLMMGISEGWEFFDFTVGEERYKLSWASDTPEVHRLFWYPSTVGGKLHSATNRVAQTARATFKFSQSLLPIQVRDANLPQ